MAHTYHNIFYFTNNADITHIGGISIPFTTTAITAQQLGIPSIYYHPSDVLLSSHNNKVPVLTSLSELSTWYYNLLYPVVYTL